MIAEVKGARLLWGFRGRPAADLEALADTLVRVSYLAMHLEGHLAELDINPLMVLPSGRGVKAVDAIVVVSRPIAPHVPESLTQKSARPNCRRQRTALEPTTAAQPCRRVSLLMPRSRHPLGPKGGSTPRRRSGFCQPRCGCVIVRSRRTRTRNINCEIRTG
jgi:hypothetical protein